MSEMGELLDKYIGTDAGTRVGKHMAVHPAVVGPMLDRLQATDPEAFDVLLWHVWWLAHRDAQVRWREKVIGELNVAIAQLERVTNFPQGE